MGRYDTITVAEPKSFRRFMETRLDIRNLIGFNEVFLFLTILRTNRQLVRILKITNIHPSIINNKEGAITFAFIIY